MLSHYSNPQSSSSKEGSSLNDMVTARNPFCLRTPKLIYLGPSTSLYLYPDVALILGIYSISVCEPTFEYMTLYSRQGYLHGSLDL